MIIKEQFIESIYGENTIKIKKTKKTLSYPTSLCQKLSITFITKGLTKKFCTIV